MSFDTSQLRALAADLAAAPAAVAVAAELSVEAAGRAIAAEAEANAPVLTGALAGGFTFTRNGLTASVFNNAEYADEVEYGTSDTPAQPSLGPAFESHQGLLGEDLGDLAARLLG